MSYFVTEINYYGLRTKFEGDEPLVLEADQGPLNVEHIVTDDVGLAVLHKKLEVVHGLLNTILIQDVSDKAKVYVGCETVNLVNSVTIVL